MVQTRPENLYSTVAQQRANFDQIFAAPMPVTNIASQVQAVGFSAGSYSYPLWIAACEYKGILRMRIVQSFESDRLATVIYEELAALFPSTTYTDRGHHDFDSFPLGSVPRKDNK